MVFSGKVWVCAKDRETSLEIWGEPDPDDHCCSGITQGPGDNILHLTLDIPPLSL